MNECVVYHKHLAGMDTSDGYIGISKHYEERQKQHHRDAFVRDSIYTVHERMRMHGNEVITSIIFEGSINDCLDLEEELRPRWHMGWNMAIGGGRPGSGWKPSKLWLDNRLWHPIHGEVTLCKEFKQIDMVRKYTKRANCSAAGNIAAVLQGKIPTAYEWELANAQLAQRVKEKYHMKWEIAFLKNNETIIKLNKTGHKDFIKAYNLNSSIRMKKVITGSQQILCGWELATEEEWLATEERLEYK